MSAGLSDFEHHDVEEAGKQPCYCILIIPLVMFSEATQCGLS